MFEGNKAEKLIAHMKRKLLPTDGLEEALKLYKTAYQKLPWYIRWFSIKKPETERQKLIKAIEEAQLIARFSSSYTYSLSTIPNTLSFPIACEIYAGGWAKELVNTIKKYSKLENFFAWEYSPPLIQKVESKKEKYEQRYKKLKTYFNDQIKNEQITKLTLENPLQDPLIYFDDPALRIFIGYGPIEFNALFPDFKATFNELYDCARNPVFIPLYSEYAKSLNDEETRLLKENFTEVTYTYSKDLSSINKSHQESEWISDYFKDQTGLIIGESHRDKSPKQFLINNMEHFKRYGVTTIYLEHILDTHQTLLDEYIDSNADDDKMPVRLEKYLAYLDTQNNLQEPASFTGIIKAAKQYKIRVIAIDTEATYRLGGDYIIADLSSNEQLIKRCKVMNHAMKKRYDFYKNDKFLVFVGNAHVSNVSGVSGLSKLLGCPHLVILDSSDKPTTQEMEYHHRGLHFHWDMVYHRNPEADPPSLDQIQNHPTTSSQTVARFTTSSVGPDFPTKDKSVVTGQNQFLFYPSQSPSQNSTKTETPSSNTHTPQMTRNFQPN